MVLIYVDRFAGGSETRSVETDDVNDTKRENLSSLGHNAERVPEPLSHLARRDRQWQLVLVYQVSSSSDIRLRGWHDLQDCGHALVSKGTSCQTTNAKVTRTTRKIMGQLKRQ